MLRLVKQESFQPRVLGIFSNPFYLIRRAIFKAIKKEAPKLNGILMDFGAGRKPYKSLFNVSAYIGVDIEKSGHSHDNSQIDVYYDGITIPFPDDHFDSILCSEVLEHIFEPDLILPELFRTLKPGGKILITVPFCWNEHEIPYDFARYSSFGIRHLLEKHFFNIIHMGKAGNFGAVLFQMLALYIFEIFKPMGRTGYAISLIFIAPLNLLAIILLPLLPKNKTLYFNNIIVAEK